MSTTEQKALELADRLQQDFNSEYINWDNVIEAVAELRRLAEVEREALSMLASNTETMNTATGEILELRAQVETLTDGLICKEAALIEWFDKTDWVSKTAKPSELGKHRADVLRERVEALTAERTVTHRKVAEASEAMSWAMANCDIAGRSYFFERKLEGLRGVLANAPTPSPLTRPASAIAQEARGYVREITTSWDRDNLHDCIDRLEEMASLQTQTAALTRPAVPEGWLMDGSMPTSRADIERVVLEWAKATGAVPVASSWYGEILGMALESYDLGAWQAATPQPEADDLEITNASLQSEVWHLSTLCDEQRQLLADVEKEFGTDAHGIEFEDGDSKLIDRVRAHLAMVAAPQPEAQPTEAAQKGGV